MYYYSTVNGIIMTHSALLEKDGFDIVKVHFERPNDDGFDFDREQACAISDMRMSVYTALEKDRTKKEIQELLMKM